jgi:hypothetical protein
MTSCATSPIVFRLLRPVHGERRRVSYPVALHDPDFRDGLTAMTATWKIGPKEQVAVRTLGAMAKAIGQQKELDELVL